jgi:predicted PolB exonuclease-like 3'-5' exonuclease
MKKLVLDIETIPITGEVLTEEEAKKAALDALAGRIICIGFIIIDDFRAQSAVSIVSDDETKLLSGFWSMLRRENIRSFVAHNGLSFDLPYIWKRSVINRVKPSLDLDLRRYRSDFVYDTMCVWGNWEIRGNASLNALAGGLGLGTKSGSGGQVLQLWREARYKDIAEYCLQDCWLTYQCYVRMNFSPTTDQTAVEADIRVDVRLHSTEKSEVVEI